METIQTINSMQGRRLAFTLLCLSKYWMLINPSADGWVNNDDVEIMRLANIKTSIKRQCLLYHSLRDMGLIRFSKKVDNTNVQVLFSCAGGDAAHISDFRNLGYQYMILIGDPKYTTCQSCGLAIRDKSVMQDGRSRSGRKQLLCEQCAARQHSTGIANHVYPTDIN